MSTIDLLPNDSKVRRTVLAIVETFFAINNTILLYLCETGDNKQSLRSRLFERWFNTYNKRRYFTCMSSTVKDTEGVDNYVALIIRNDNPNFTEIINNYATTIQFFTDKPQSRSVILGEYVTRKRMKLLPSCKEHEPCAKKLWSHSLRPRRLRERKNKTISTSR